MATTCLAIAAATLSSALAAIGDAPPGCRRNLNWIYFSLCNLKEGWGILVEALAVLGLLLCLGLTLALLVLGIRAWRLFRRGAALLALRFMLVAGTWGLLGLSFAFVVKAHPDNCTARRFLFGTLFGLCFSSLAVQAGRLAWISRAGTSPSGPACLVSALGLFLVECLIKAEWLVISTTRARPLESFPGQNPCSVTKGDFVGALVYVMCLLALGLVLSCVGLCCSRRADKRQAAYLLASSCLSVAVWVACLATYLRGERRPSWLPDRDAWDDSPLAALLLANGWVLLGCCLLPWVLEARRQAARDGEEEEETETETESLGLRKAGSLGRAITDNKAFQLEEVAGKRLKSPFEDVKPATVILKPLEQDKRSSNTSNVQYRTHFL